MTFVLLHWKWFVMGALIAALGVQSYRLQGTQGELVLLQQWKANLERDQARRDASNLRNKERTDEEHAAAQRRAAASVVRAKSVAIVAAKPAPDAGGDHQSAGCVSRREIDRVVDEFAEEHARELAALASELSRQHAEEATRAAVEFEKLAASYRSCRVFAIDTE